MIPIAESVPIRRTPWVTGLIVLACVALFLYELLLTEPALEVLIQRWGVHARSTPTITLFTSQFLHGGWLHLIGNMVFLWVFGRPVEDQAGHLRYLLIYLLGGAAAGYAQSLVELPDPEMAAIGASGAIATILGVYLVLFPTAWVTALVPVFFFFWTFDVPAVVMLLFWFVGQFFTGIASISRAGAAGDVAVWAHVAGFVVGVLVGFLLPRGVRRPRQGVLVRRADGPGPARLVSSVADLACLALFGRVALLFLEVRPGPGPLGQVAQLAYRVTEPFVHPFAEFVPVLLFAGRPIDLPAIVLLILLHALGGWLASAIARRGSFSPA